MWKMGGSGPAYATSRRPEVSRGAPSRSEMTALVGHAVEHASQFAGGQKRHDGLADGGGVDRPFGADILHDAHRPFVVALGDDLHDAVAIGGQARARAAGACQFGNDGLRDDAELFRRPCAARELEQFWRQLIGT